MIEVDRLTKYYGPVAAIQDVSFSVEKGAIVGFLGPNGAGKTTTMRILSCFMPASSGSARVAGYDVFEQSLEVRRRIGYLPENVPLYGDMTVASYLDFVAEAKGLGRAERRRRVGEVMARCLIEDVQGRLIGRLSKGYRQRVGLAQAILGNPAVLILDEPTAGLDPKQIIETRDLIRGLGGEHTIILSTHILPEVEMTCGRVVIINKGRVVAEDTPKNLTRRLKGSASLRVEVRGDVAAAQEALAAVPGVTAVRPRPEGADGGVFEVEAEAGRDVRAELAAAVVQRGLGLLGLHQAAMSLEDVFLELTTTDAANAPAASPEVTA
jgi:ABC-2 type transport system ATP-binding protein